MNDHLSWLELSRKQYSRNIRAIQTWLGRCLLAPVVKANAYGHGLQQICRLLVEEGISVVCVNYIQEAELMRAEGYQGRVVLIGPYHSKLFDRALKADVEVVVGSQLAIEVWLQMDKKPKIHLKIESGMSRQGFELAELLGKYSKTLELAANLIRGVSTHFPNPEIPEEAKVTAAQWSGFQSGCVQLKKLLGVHRQELADFMCHGLSSRPALVVKKGLGDMARLGLLTYGLWPDERFLPAFPELAKQLAPVLSWKARIVMLKRISRGTSVGYGSTFTATDEMKIAVLPVGYNEGYSRLAVTHPESHVLIGGVCCPLVARGCMNMIYIDVSRVHCEQGDEAVLVGQQAGLQITWDQLAKWEQTISYESLTRLPSELPRKVV